MRLLHQRGSIMIISTLLAAAAAIVSIAPAPALAGGSAATTAAAAEAPASRARRAEPKYCVRAQTTGSRIARKVCKTKQQWDAAGEDIFSK